MPFENVLAGYGIPKDRLVVAPEEIGDIGGALNFEAALRSAIAAFLNDEKGTGVNDSPLAAVINVPDAHGLSAGASASDCSAKLLEYIKTDPEGKIVLLTPSTLAQQEYSFTPEKGESTDDNWVFRIKLPTTFDILMWSIVDKTGAKPAYCYSVE